MSTVKTIASVPQGGTGAESQADARTGLGLGSVATESTVPVSKGGTGLTAVGTGLQVLRTNSGATALEWSTPSTVATSIVASATSRAAANTARTGAEATPTLKKSIQYKEVAGTIRVYFSLAGPTGTGYGRIYKNGSPVGTQRSSTSGAYTEYTEDISVAYDDYVQIYAWASGTYGVQNFSIRYDKQFDVTSSTVITD